MRGRVMPDAARQPAGLLLDMDGTLVDTEALWFEAAQVATERCGGLLPDDAEALLMGIDTDTMLSLLRRRFGAEADVETLRAAVFEALGERLGGAHACPGAAELVAAATAAGVCCAVVSNSPAGVVHATLAPHPWAARLRVRVTVENVRRPKPAPDLYRLALARLGLAAADCVAIEDSPTGARSAVAAGVRCLGVARAAEHAAALHAVTPHVVRTLHEAARWLDLPVPEGATPHDRRTRAPGDAR
jgi:HAD superfamily hydrolase (TIGR01509 family)